MPQAVFDAHGSCPISVSMPTTPVQSHGVSYAEISKLPAILYLYTGNEDYRKFVVAAQRRVFDHHMLIDGIPSSSEGYAGTTALDEHETCDITDHAWAWTYIMQATGDGVWGDHIERACFNAHPGVTKNRLEGHSIFRQPQPGSGQFELRSRDREMVWEPAHGLPAQSGADHRMLRRQQTPLPAQLRF